MFNDYYYYIYCMMYKVEIWLTDFNNKKKKNRKGNVHIFMTTLKYCTHVLSVFGLKKLFKNGVPNEWPEIMDLK